VIGNAVPPLFLPVKIARRGLNLCMRCAFWLYAHDYERAYCPRPGATRFFLSQFQLHTNRGNMLVQKSKQTNVNPDCIRSYPDIGRLHYLRQRKKSPWITLVQQMMSLLSQKKEALAVILRREIKSVNGRTISNVFSPVEWGLRQGQQAKQKMIFGKLTPCCDNSKEISISWNRP